MARRGRPTKYTPELAEEICERLAAGESLKAICAEEGKPSKGAVIGWVLDDREGFSDRYARAREAAGHVEGDEVAEIGRRTLEGDYDPQAARVAIDALKWSAGRKASKYYGDKQHHEHSGPEGRPIEYADRSQRIAAILERAEARKHDEQG